MLTLATGTSLLELRLAGAVTTNQLPWVTSYAIVGDVQFTPAESSGQSSNTTAVTFMPSPGAGQYNQLKCFSIRNADTATATVILNHDTGATEREILRATLAVNDTLFYECGRGWYTIDASGNTKVTSSGSGITVEEVDGSPSYVSTTTLRVDQADGFVLTQPSANIVRLDQADFGTSQAGKVPASGGGSTNFLRADGSWAVPPGTGTTSANKGLIDGLITAYSSTTAITVGAGKCRDSSDTYDLSWGGGTKVIQAAGSWTAGSGNNGLDTGARANSTWYHIFVIRKTADGTADILISTSATSPSMPAGYSGSRRIGAVKTDGSSNIVKWFQKDDTFIWDVPVQDITVSNPGTSAVTRTLASVPTGVSVFPIAWYQAYNASTNHYVLITSLDQVDTAASSTVYTGEVTGGGAGYVNTFPVRNYTNTSAQIRTRSSASGASDTVRITVHGWIDPRGQNNG